MDSLKNISKGGWKPGSSSSSTSSTGEKKSTITGLGVRSKLSDAKGRATGRDVDSLKHREAALNHQSRPLSSLKDPASFAPPPKHSAYYGNTNSAGQGLIANGSGSSSSTVIARRNEGPTGGLGAPAVESGYAARKAAEQREREEQAEIEAEAERARRREIGYLKDTSGLRTDNLPKPPVRRIATEESEPAPGRRQSPALPARTQSPALPARTQSPALPPRRTGAPPPVLPPRQNEYPDEHTPAPPPAYQEALKSPAVHNAAGQAYQQHSGAINQFAANRLGQAGISPAHQNALQSPAVQNAVGQAYQQNSGVINQFAANRLGQAGVSVPGLGIGGGSGATSTTNDTPQQTTGHGSQLGELQQRFAKMGTGASGSTTVASPSAQTKGVVSAAAIAAQKKPAPPPPPKKNGLSVAGGSSSAPAPPPLPLSSKPRPPM